MKETRKKIEPQLPKTTETVEVPVLGEKYIFAVGKRKSAIAQIKLYPHGKGLIYVNGKEYKQIFPQELSQRALLEPLVLSSQKDGVNIAARVVGGGVTARAAAIRHGVAKALVIFDATYRKPLKKAGFLTRDSRIKERKKFGLKKARRAPQWSKR